MSTERDTSAPLSKRERQKARRDETQRADAARRNAAGRRRVVVGAVAVVVLLGLVALAFVLSPGGRDAPAPAVDAEVGSVEVTGDPLPPLEAQGADPAVGTPAPVVAGDGVTVGEGPQVIAFMAHWCPVCQREVPEVVDWVADGALPDDVTLVNAATFNDPARANFPAVPWLEDAGWPGEILLDGAADEAARAYGVTATPTWVFVDADGTVVQRVGGQIDRAAFEEGAAAAG